MEFMLQARLSTPSNDELRVVICKNRIGAAYSAFCLVKIGEIRVWPS
jgi:hypothetical protein